VLDQVLKSYLEHICGKANVEENVLMSTRTTFRIGGSARFFVTVQSKEILIKLVSALNYIEYPYRIVGHGANLLVSDNGYDGVLIKLNFREIVENGNFVYADAGATLGAVVKFARSRGLSGLEFAAGIPGTVGGAVYMNAGAYGGQISDIAAMVDVLQNGEIVSLDARACKFSYRTSRFQKSRNQIVMGVYFFLKSGDKCEIEKREQEILLKRRATSVKEPNAGSIFRNPTVNGVVVSAGKLIDELGLKGTRIGDAAISRQHAGKIINLRAATARDVRALITLVKTKVRVAYGITLKTEIEFL